MANAVDNSTSLSMARFKQLEQLLGKMAETYGQKGEFKQLQFDAETLLNEFTATSSRGPGVALLYEGWRDAFLGADGSEFGTIYTAWFSGSSGGTALENALLTLHRKLLIKVFEGMMQLVLQSRTPSAAPVRKSATELMTRITEYFEERGSPLAPIETKINNSDGPFAPNGFRWKGQEFYGLTSTPFNLVSYLWEAKDHTARLDELAKPVWRDHAVDVSRDQAGSARKAANHFFSQNSLPCRISLSGEYITLKNTT